jgi:transposase
VIRVEALWLSVAPLDMRAGMDTLLAQVVRVFGEARPHHAYLFANRRGTRMKVLIHDGQGSGSPAGGSTRGASAGPRGTAR